MAEYDGICVLTLEVQILLLFLLLSSFSQFSFIIQSAFFHHSESSLSVSFLSLLSNWSSQLVVAAELPHSHLPSIVQLPYCQNARQTGIDRRDCLLMSLIGDAEDLLETEDLGEASSPPSSILTTSKIDSSTFSIDIGVHNLDS